MSKRNVCSVVTPDVKLTAREWLYAGKVSLLVDGHDETKFRLQLSRYTSKKSKSNSGDRNTKMPSKCGYLTYEDSMV